VFDELLIMRYFFFLSALIIVFSCTDANKKAEVQKKLIQIVLFQPLQFSDTATLFVLKDSIEQFYPVTVIISPNKQFPDHIYYKPGKRYRADRIIRWLNLNKPDSVRSVVGITAMDVSTTKNNMYDYGVMGLGYHPGHACVVSTFRPAKTAKNKEHLRQRLLRLVIHEMGHNFNLPHCPDEQCFMVDAEGQMKLDKEKYLCSSCKKKLKI
jgi:archaemetzincin